MTSTLHPRYLEVHLYDRLCGYLCEAGGNVRFVPAEGYRGERGRPTLSLSMTIPTDAGEAATAAILSQPSHRALYNVNHLLPPYFAGLLPESELRARLESTRHNPADRDDFGILAAGGKDLFGAVTVVPANLDTLPEYARTYGVTGGADNLEIAVVEDATEGAASISGVQNKLALSTALKGKRYTLPVHGKVSDMIAKLPAKNDDSQVYNEWMAMQLAASAGVTVASTEVLPLTTIAIDGFAETLGPELTYLAVSRFDRTPAGGRVHAEDGCQILTRMPAQKYGQEESYIGLVKLLWALSPSPAESVRQFFLRQAVNNLLGNSDAHLKNFSFVYRDGKLPELSPAYDIVCVSALPAFSGYAKNVAIDKLQRAQTLDTYKAIARSAGVSEKLVTAAVKDAVRAAKETWADLFSRFPVPDEVRERVRDTVLERLETLPLVKLR